MILKIYRVVCIGDLLEHLDKVGIRTPQIEVG
jgi:hypothetical protein